MERISKNRLKQIATLKQKKCRTELNLFLVEGEKIVGELLKSNLNIKAIIATSNWFSENNLKFSSSIEYLEAKEDDLARISSLTTPNKVIAVVEILPANINYSNIQTGITLLLDDIQDPGNLGTIIRLADWFGIKNIVCSENTAELYNPKVIQATMGAFLRVNVFYTDLEHFIKNIPASSKIDVFGTFIKGENIYKTELPEDALVVMGNESKGISKNIERLVTRKITIPSFSANPDKSESLNVAIATGIVCSEFRRRRK